MPVSHSTGRFSGAKMEQLPSVFTKYPGQLCTQRDFLKSLNDEYIIGK